jgi:hypothetical protein
MIQLQKKSASHLVSAYNQMIKVMREAFEQANASDMSLQKALNLAKNQAEHSGKISTEEAFEIGEYIKRDINDAAEYMMESSAEFYEWLLLDIEDIERKVMELFLAVADHTRIELEQFKLTKPNSEPVLTEQIPVYKSGEITESGTLICENCGKAKPFLSSDIITNCERCEHNRFIRRHHQNN